MAILGSARAAHAMDVAVTAVTPTTVLLEWDRHETVRTTKSRRWAASLPTGSSHRAVIADGEGRSGSHAARITGKSTADDARGCFILNLPDVTEPGRYAYSFYYRGKAPANGGAPRLIIDCYTGDDRKHKGLLANRLPLSPDWSEVSGGFTLPPDVRLTRILLYQMGEGTAWFDDVRLSRDDGEANLVGDVGGFGDIRHWRVFFRKRHAETWSRSGTVILERFHNVISLQPATDYDFKLQHVGTAGQVLNESPILSATTEGRPENPEPWQGLLPGDSERLALKPSIYPCVESVNGRLYVADSRAGSLWLSELDESGTIRWTKEWVKPYMVDGKRCYQGQTQSAVLGDTILISWKRAHDGDAPNARQCVASYDTVTGRIGEPYVVEPDRPGESTWNGGIAVVNGRVWISYCRWRRQEGRAKTTVTVRAFDPKARRLGRPFELHPQPTDTPYTPFLSVFNDELVICFTAMASTPDRQPLWLVRFDGNAFHGLMTVSPDGYNQYAKGVQVADRLLLVWKYGAPYPSRIYGRYMFHDIGLASVDPVEKRADITSIVHDFRYNSSPDVTWHDGRLVYVYNKFEHLYGDRGDPGTLNGCFLGTIEPERP